jgi:hypothetical protein
VKPNDAFAEPRRCLARRAGSATTHGRSRAHQYPSSGCAGCTRDAHAEQRRSRRDHRAALGGSATEARVMLGTTPKPEFFSPNLDSGSMSRSSWPGEVVDRRGATVCRLRRRLARERRRSPAASGSASVDGEAQPLEPRAGSIFCPGAPPHGAPDDTPGIGARDGRLLPRKVVHRRT